jgi:hypothetical protein
MWSSMYGRVQSFMRRSPDHDRIQSETDVQSKYETVFQICDASPIRNAHSIWCRRCRLCVHPSHTHASALQFGMDIWSRPTAQPSTHLLSKPFTGNRNQIIQSAIALIALMPLFIDKTGDTDNGCRLINSSELHMKKGYCS